MTRLINFTKGEALALRHRLTAGTLGEVLESDEPGGFSAEAIDDRCNEHEATLRTAQPFVCLGDEGTSERELDLAILADCVEGSTWVAVHDPEGDTNNTPQGKAAARRALNGAADKICRAFGKAPSYIQVPNG